MDDLRAMLNFRFHRPAECHGVVFRHVRAHDDDAVRVLHAAWIHGGGAAAESGPQTGDAGAVSYSRLVLDRDHAQAPHELLMDVVELDLESRAAEREYRRRHVDELAVWQVLDERFVARLAHELRDSVHGPLEVPYFPIGCTGRAVQYLRWTVRIDVKLENGRALGAERSFVVRT